jgi:hypothetical protein
MKYELTSFSQIGPEPSGQNPTQFTLNQIASNLQPLTFLAPGQDERYVHEH